MPLPRAALLAALICALAPAGLYAQVPATANADGVYTSRRPGARVLGIALGGTPQGEGRWADFPVVRDVVPDSDPARAGFRVGDVILSVNGKDAREMSVLRGHAPGTRLAVRIRRGLEEKELVMEITGSVPVPSPPAAPAPPTPARP